VKVCVAGLWHLGMVTAACLAAAGHDVVGYDHDPAALAAVASGRLPVFEPGLDDLVRSAVEHQRLSFEADPRKAVAAADVLWIAWDTPVDEDDRADDEAVLERVDALLAAVAPGALVIVSSQLPVGSTARIERRCAELRPGCTIDVVCSPENLRLGTAIDAFTRPNRVVVGTRGDGGRARIATLLAPFTDRIEWMSVESAEMTKHALNAFLATSVAFANEIAAISEQVGADAIDVARALKSDPRVGPRAYLAPGGSFAGGTLARDVVSLTERASALRLPLHLIPAVRDSNEAHRAWALRRLESVLGGVEGRTVAVWGLTYKPGTDTLRRSDAVALCHALAARGAATRVFDPTVRTLPAAMAGFAALAASPTDAARGAEAVVIGTEWPIFRDVSADALVAVGAPLVVDAGRFLAATLGSDRRLRYVAVGSPVR
jgi:UDPglucose 6-dehydrogenase